MERIIVLCIFTVSNGLTLKRTDDGMRSSRTGDLNISPDGSRPTRKPQRSPLRSAGNMIASAFKKNKSPVSKRVELNSDDSSNDGDDQSPSDAHIMTIMKEQMLLTASQLSTAAKENMLNSHRGSQLAILGSDLTSFSKGDYFNEKVPNSVKSSINFNSSFQQDLLDLDKEFYDNKTNDQPCEPGSAGPSVNFETDFLTIYNRDGNNIGRVALNAPWRDLVDRCKHLLRAQHKFSDPSAKIQISMYIDDESSIKNYGHRVRNHAASDTIVYISTENSVDKRYESVKLSEVNIVRENMSRIARESGISISRMFFSVMIV
eukprot:gene952-876_t